MIIGGAIGIRHERAEMTEMPELVRHPAQLRGSGGGAGGLQQLPVPRTGPGADSGEHPPDRSVPRHLHRCGDLHRVDCGDSASCGKIFQTADAAEPPQAETWRRWSFPLCCWWSSCVPSVGLQVLALLVIDHHRAGLRLASGGVYRRSRYAGGGFHAELLLRLGGGGGRLYAEQRPADCHRCAGPVLPVRSCLTSCVRR